MTAALVDTIRFNLFSVETVGSKFVVYDVITRADIRCAAIMAGVTEEDFIQSVAHTGWLGSCPEWTDYRAVVTLPVGELLSDEHLQFLAEYRIPKGK